MKVITPTLLCSNRYQDNNLHTVIYNVRFTIFSSFYDMISRPTFIEQIESQLCSVLSAQDVLDDEELAVLGDSAEDFRDGFKRPSCDWEEYIGVYKIRKILTEDFDFVKFMKIISDNISNRFKIKANLKFFTHYHPYFISSAEQKLKYNECEFLDETVDETDESRSNWHETLNGIGDHFLWAAYESDMCRRTYDYDFDERQIERKAFVLDVVILFR